MRIINLDKLTFDENVEYNKIALEIRSEFNDFVEKISKNNINNIHWIVTSLASRNKYQSALFYRCCQIVLVQRLIDRDKKINIIYVSDRALAQLLKKEINKSVKIVCTQNYFNRVWQFMRPFRQILISYYYILLRLLARSKSNIRQINPNIPLTLIDTFVLNNKDGDEGSIKNGKYRDRYYPGLLENLTENQKNNLFFMPTIVGFNNPISIFKRIRNCNYPFLLHDDLLKLSDYFFVMAHPFKVLRLKFEKIKFRNIDLSLLLKQENRRNCGDFISLLGIIYYRFAYRLSKSNLNVRLLIEWYENQVMDRGMIVGFHKFLPKTKVIGYQGYIISKGLHIYTQPNNTEYDGMAVPDTIAVTGKALKANILEFCSRAKVQVAPGFRFQNVWRKRKAFPDNSVYDILIGLPIGLDDCKKIIDLFLSNYNLINNENYNFIIKPHPTWSPDVIKGLFSKNALNKFEFILGDFHDILEKVNLVVSNASSVSLEAVAKGVPVIIISPQNGILQNPIPDDVDKCIWTICNNSLELERQISTFRKDIALNALRFHDIGNIIRNNYFEPVTKESVKLFLDF